MLGDRGGMPALPSVQPDRPMASRPGPPGCRAEDRKRRGRTTHYESSEACPRPVPVRVAQADEGLATLCSALPNM